MNLMGNDKLALLEILSNITSKILKIKSPIIVEDACIKTLIESEDTNINKCIIIEECSELIKALTKEIRNKENAREMIIEEIVDVLIGIQMCVSIYNISQDELDEEYNNKMFRNLSRIYKKYSNGKSR